MIQMQGKRLRSERLTYRLLESNDRSALHALLSDPDVTAPAGFLPAETAEQFDAFFETLTRYQTAIAILLGETLIGYIHVNKYTPDAPAYQDKRCVSTGFVIGRAYQNQGYATETLRTVTAYLRERFDACIADCFAENVASRRVIEKCGSRYLESYSMYFEELQQEKTCHSYVF